jgi:hypothetical protein
MLPALPLPIITSTRSDQMQMGMVLSIASMRVERRDVASPERFPPDLTIELIHALHPTAHQPTQQDRSVMVEGRTEHGRDR